MWKPVITLAIVAALATAAGSGAATPGTASYVPKGKIVADLGFRPNPDGFRFENYGASRFDLDPAAMQLLFGRAVCVAGRTTPCLLHPPARAWMEEGNAAMAGGHCQGFSVASLLLYDEEDHEPADFGAPKTWALKRTAVLQRFLAYGFVFQVLDRVVARRVSGTPRQVLDRLIKDLRGGNELWTVGIYQTDFDTGEVSGGHAVTPFAVELRPDGLHAILIYDNNWPGQTRAILVDRAANEWSYKASINPNEPSDLYRGNAQTRTLELDPTFAGLGVQPCPFCGAAGSTYSTRQAAAKRYDRISLTGDPRNHPHLLITDQKGRRLGYVGAKLVREIPGAQIVQQKLDVAVWKARAEPEYRVPSGLKLRVTLDGSRLTKPSTSSFALITRGRNIVVNNIRLAKGQKSTLVVTSGGSYSFRSDRRQTAPPRLRVGFQGVRRDREFTVRPRRFKGGAKLGLTLTRRGELLLDSAGAGRIVYDLEMEVLDEDGTETFEEEGLEVTDEENDVLDYEEWDDEGEDAPIDDVADGDASEEDEELAEEDEELEEEEEEPRTFTAFSNLF